MKYFMIFSAKKLEFIFLLFLIFGFHSCKKEKADKPKPSVELSSVASEYLKEALDIIEAKSINKYKIDWPSYREKVIKFAKSAQTKRQTYDAIRYALVELGDNHSFFRESPIQTTAQMNTEIIKKSTIASNELRAQRLNDQIGFIRIPSFSGDNVARDLFAQDIQDLIRRTDRVSINAWVVDLRQNNGGNMWPMLAGIGPILGEGIAGYFVDPDSVSTSWSYANGQAMMNSMIALEIDKPYVLNNLNPSVAVLTDGRTGSSGEAMVVSFIGRNNTRSFGEPTYGVSTANRNFDLSDGAQIVLTVATMADRNGVLYGAKIEPDEIVDGFFKEDPSNDDEVVNRAVEWLENNLNKLR